MYELVIVGAGPGGLTASIYASFLEIEHVVIGKEVGGQLRTAPKVFNFPGFPEGIEGKELVERVRSQVEENGGEIVKGEIVKISRSNSGFEVVDKTRKTYGSQSVILATGAIEERKKSEVAGSRLARQLGAELSEQGVVKVDERFAATVEGVFAVGDMVNYFVNNEQLTLVVGQGAKAAESAYEYLRGEKAPTVWGKSLIKRR